MIPATSRFENILIVRDDLYPGGTKARIFAPLFGRHDEIVYASPAQGGAQTALAHAAAATGKRATIFVAKRATPHPRALEAKRAGAQVLQVTPGYLTVVQARARAYCDKTGAYHLPFGADIAEAPEIIAAAARSLAIEPAEVWCAAGSGVLMRGLARAWPKARRHAVQVGRALKPADVAGARIHIYPKPYDYALAGRGPFPADPHYDAKAWEICASRRGAGLVLFWNVTGPAQPL
jgi:hypothetical protein